jgi:peptide/nickel transport system permease protein
VAAGLGAAAPRPGGDRLGGDHRADRGGGGGRARHRPRRRARPQRPVPSIGLTTAGLPVGPSRRFLLGTDNLGRDLLVRIVYGARISLLVGVVATLLATVAGVVVGLVAGYFGGVVDVVLARFMDMVLSFPYLLLAIALVSVFGPSLTITILVIAFFSWAAIGRVVRGQTLSIREQDYVAASWSVGSGALRVMFVEILPNLLAPVLVLATLLVPTAIVFEATLSFLGLGWCRRRRPGAGCSATR